MASTAGGETPEPPLQPTAPFDDASADTILRSSDGSSFHVCRAVLASASPFYRAMFSLPQPDSEPAVPVIEVSESSHLLNRFLRMWYPGADQIAAFHSLDELCELVALALLKYDVQFIAPHLQLCLLGFLAAHPVDIFAIACRYRWRAVAHQAANACLKLPLASLLDCPAPTQLKHISADLYHALITYHRKCGVAASAGVPSASACAWPLSYTERAQARLKDTPAADLFDPMLIAPAHAESAMCAGACRTTGPIHLAQLITEEYAPAVKCAIEAVPLDLGF
ncbi:hypothetical protein B0H15DRAFT_954807 [Mycena belliarum]|uniref:BTB domain-containing protein n=1 Tax=Mycena belliarum TaxID=1033014 RepID=A0AAD6TWR8_9AGAR|nr:hypothetical protein B0H15DRAFT_954807 [Mycena belliae]